MPNPDSAPIQPNASSSNAELWRLLARRLHSAHLDAKKQIPPSSSPVDSTLPIEEASKKWFLECGKTREPVRDLVQDWLRTGVVPHDDFEQYRLFLSARFETAFRFVRQFVIVQRQSLLSPPGDISIFPFPNMTPEEVLSFLLLDWWMCVGMDEYFERAQESIQKPTLTQ